MARVAHKPRREARNNGNSWSLARYPRPGTRPASSEDVDARVSTLNYFNEVERDGHFAALGAAVVRPVRDLQRIAAIDRASDHDVT